LVRILAFTDPHGKLEAYQSLKHLAESEQPDLILCGGDVSFFGDDYDLFLRGLGGLGQTVYFVPGNHETPSTTKSLELQFSYLRNVTFRVVEVGGVRLAGLPASDAFWPGARPDEGLRAKAVAMGESGDRKKPFVLLTHYPPAGTQVSGTSVMTPDSGGSRLVRQIVEALSPALVVCGHYHQDFGKEAHVGRTWIVNPGPGGRMLELANPSLSGPVA
jgi:Icc-related predicted phosphoesterase